ncbi:MAG: hypothetical protein CMM01_17545 [Rhodopirellula sp.]|nr:hypothetical protein [Rhodopirellula sp.]
MLALRLQWVEFDSEKATLAVRSISEDTQEQFLCRSDDNVGKPRDTRFCVQEFMFFGGLRDLSASL